MAVTKLLSPTPVQNQEKARPIRLLWHFRRQDFAFSLWEGPASARLLLPAASVGTTLKKFKSDCRCPMPSGGEGHRSLRPQ